jgi:soluble lytic murein transglycosylase-like protein
VGKQILKTSLVLSAVLSVALLRPSPVRAEIFLGRTDTGSVTLTNESDKLDAYDTFVLLVEDTQSNAQPNPEQLQTIVSSAAESHGLPESLIYAVIGVESDGETTVESEDGAVGLMQLMPGTARHLGVEDPYDPSENVHGGTRYLRRLMNRFKGDLDRALAAYNAGPSAVKEHGGIPPYRETRRFVRRVRDRFERLKAEGDMIYTYRDENGVLNVTNVH